MNFNKKQLDQISKFIQKYNNPELKKSIEDNYLNNPGQLSILEIYALEEILRIGHRNIYNNFIEEMEAASIENPVEQLNQFLNFYNENNSFKSYKLQQYEENPETLSEIELYALEKIIKIKIEPKKAEDHSIEDSTEELEYDDFNPIRYENEFQIKETLTNLLIGEFIFNLLDLPNMTSIKARQKQPGMISNVDKPTIIKTTYDTIRNNLEQLPQAIKQMYTKVRLNILLGMGEDAFEEYSKYNTNISAREIFEYEDVKQKKKKI